MEAGFCGNRHGVGVRPGRRSGVLAAACAAALVVGLAGAGGAAADPATTTVVVSIRVGVITVFPGSASGGGVEPAAVLDAGGETYLYAPAFDGSGDLWASELSSGGLVEFTPAQVAAGEQQTPVATIDLAGDAFFWSLAFDGGGNLWAGTSDGSVVEYTAAQLARLQVEPNPTPAAEIDVSSQSYVEALAFDGAGDLWVGYSPSDDEGAIVEYSADQLAHATPATGATPADTITSSSWFHRPVALAFDRSGDLWVGNIHWTPDWDYDSSLLEYTPAQLVPGATAGTDGRPASSIGPWLTPTGLAFDTSGNLWASILEGEVQEFSAAQLAAVQAEHDPDNGNSDLLPANTITSWVLNGPPGQPYGIAVWPRLRFAQTIAFSSRAPATAAVGGSYAVAASGGGSAGPVVFAVDASSTPGACSLVGATVSFTGVGECVLDANQDGDVTHDPAAQVEQSFSIGPAGSSGSVTGTSASPTGTATAALGSISAQAAGSGSLTVAQYPSNPTGQSSFGASGAYFDVKVSTGSAFTSLTITDCNLSGGSSLEWWDGTFWEAVAPVTGPTQTSPPCLTATLSSSSTPTLAQLTGTVFVASSAKPPAAPTGLSVKANPAGKFLLKWKAPAVPKGGLKITGYLVRVGTAPGREASTPVDAAKPTQGLAYELDGLTSGKTYYVTVSALNAAGAGPPSNEAWAKATR